MVCVLTWYKDISKKQKYKHNEKIYAKVKSKSSRWYRKQRSQQIYNRKTQKGNIIDAFKNSYTTKTSSQNKR